jgi:phosphatidylinositol phospholipase C beta
MMRFIVNDDAGRMIGQRIIPMESIQSGYRFISLRNEFNLPIGLFIFSFSDFFLIDKLV